MVCTVSIKLHSPDCQSMEETTNFGSQQQWVLVKFVQGSCTGNKYLNPSDLFNFIILWLILLLFVDYVRSSKSRRRSEMQILLTCHDLYQVTQEFLYSSPRHKFRVYSQVDSVAGQVCRTCCNSCNLCWCHKDRLQIGRNAKDLLLLCPNSILDQVSRINTTFAVVSCSSS